MSREHTSGSVNYVTAGCWMVRYTLWASIITDTVMGSDLYLLKDLFRFKSDIVPFLFLEVIIIIIKIVYNNRFSTRLRVLQITF